MSTLFTAGYGASVLLSEISMASTFYSVISLTFTYSQKEITIQPYPLNTTPTYLQLWQMRPKMIENLTHYHGEIYLFI